MDRHPRSPFRQLLSTILDKALLVAFVLILAYSVLFGPNTMGMGG